MFDGSRLLSEGELVTQLEKILHNSEPQEEPVGILTTADRSVWAKQRKRLLKGAYFKLYTIHYFLFYFIYLFCHTTNIMKTVKEKNRKNGFNNGEETQRKL